MISFVQKYHVCTVNSIYCYWQSPSFTQTQSSTELGTLTEWKCQQWPHLQASVTALVKTVRKDTLKDWGLSFWKDSVNKESQAPTRKWLPVILQWSINELDQRSQSLPGTSKALWYTDHTWTIPKLLRRSKEFERKKKHKQVILPEMVSQYLANQQRQYLERSHNHQIVRSDSHIPPAEFMRKN